VMCSVFLVTKVQAEAVLLSPKIARPFELSSTPFSHEGFMTGHQHPTLTHFIFPDDLIVSGWHRRRSLQRRLGWPYNLCLVLLSPKIARPFELSSTPFSHEGFMTGSCVGGRCLFDCFGLASSPIASATTWLALQFMSSKHLPPTHDPVMKPSWLNGVLDQIIWKDEMR
jgi:hypothetical protein